MVGLLIGIHVFTCLSLILIVLLQPGNKQGMGAAMGGGGAQTVFGGAGANTFLSKLTAGAAIVFMLTSLTLVWVSSSSGSVTDAFATTPNADEAKPAADGKDDTAAAAAQGVDDKAQDTPHEGATEETAAELAPAAKEEAEQPAVEAQPLGADSEAKPAPQPEAKPVAEPANQ